ncbi:tryptophan synthase subunit alpha [Balneola sp. MJW-20]|uniref:tryptophan synthase subunit alpha n=1 Tax=Gracilimonas aurantiaca TaxID=3234185 RepID=UPI003466960C
MIEAKNRLENVFEKTGNEKVMSLFLTAGYPDLDSTVDLIVEFEKNGADMIELGMPFSDPLADGPTIQYSSDIAISAGITMNRIFDMVREVRKRSDIPLILMGYMNPVLRYGVDQFCEQAADSGVDGLIIPDIPVEEAEIIENSAKANGLGMIYLIAPNTTDERMKLADEKSDGFVYCVSVTGVTGARTGEEVQNSVDRFMTRVNENVTKNPVMVGFGIKSHEDAMSIASNADGFIVGSALIDTIKEKYPEKGWIEHVSAFVHSLKFGNN